MTYVLIALILITLIVLALVESNELQTLAREQPKEPDVVEQLKPEQPVVEALYVTQAGDLRLVEVPVSRVGSLYNPTLKIEEAVELIDIWVRK